MQFLFNNRKNKIEDKLEELYELLEKKKNNQLNKNIYT